MAVPTILFVGPMIGFFAGRWADDKLGTDPYLLVAGIVLGFGAAGIEIFNLLKKASAIDKEKEDEKRS